MALVTRLRALCGLERSVRPNVVLKNRLLSVLYGAPHNAAPAPSGRTYFLKMFRKPTQRDLKIKDDVPDGFVLIYRNTMNRYILGAQIASMVAGGVVLLAFILKSDFQTRGREREFHEWSPTARTTENEDLYYIGFFVAFLVLMQVVISRTPLRIYKVPQTPKYIAVSYGNYFFGLQKYSFKVGEIFHLEEKGILPWREYRYGIETETDRRSVILLEHYFRRPADLSIMLGEQKDPDLEQ